MYVINKKPKSIEFLNAMVLMLIEIIII